MTTGTATALDPYAPDSRVQMAVHDGIRCTPIGDDGELLLALGHHPAEVLVRAFDALVRTYVDPGGLVGGDYFDTPLAAAEAVRARWAVFLAGCAPGGRCAAPYPHWRVEFTVPTQAGAVAVSILDLAGDR